MDLLQASVVSMRAVYHDNDHNDAWHILLFWFLVDERFAPGHTGGAGGIITMQDELYMFNMMNSRVMGTDPILANGMCSNLLTITWKNNPASS